MGAFTVRAGSVEFDPRDLADETKWSDEDIENLAKHFKNDANASLKSREDSWERSDTDGFLSQWASGLSAQLSNAKAEIVRNRGRAPFRRLCDKDGNEVPARLIDAKYGPCWALLDPAGKFTGVFVSDRDSTIAKKGFTTRDIDKPAWAKMAGSGRGLSGRAWVQVFPLY